MAFREHHGRVKSDDWEAPCNIQNDLDHMLTDIGLRVIELRGVVPRERRSIVAVIHESGSAVTIMTQAKHNGGIRLVVVMIFNLDFDATIRGKIRPLETVRRKWTFPARYKPFRVVDHPVRIDSHVIRDHIARQPQSCPGSTVAQVLVGRFSPKIFSN